MIFFRAAQQVIEHGQVIRLDFLFAVIRGRQDYLELSAGIQNGPSENRVGTARSATNPDEVVHAL
ncbi:hypothetical protein AB0C34_09065 [Nocardia sp. NPDC049220]|uniref:hypothetical protein n=1 Tax=Nocardia sp. NPDC049220 TaxID=3155273 RepID=UPI0033C42B97